MWADSKLPMFIAIIAKAMLRIRRLPRSAFSTPWPIPIMCKRQPRRGTRTAKLIANRYFVEIELQNQDPKELQDWVKRLDLKKLAAIK